MYKDFSHFKPEINSWMSNEMEKSTHTLTIDNYSQIIDKFNRFLNNYNYSRVYEN